MKNIIKVISIGLGLIMLTCSIHTINKINSVTNVFVLNPNKENGSTMGLLSYYENSNSMSKSAIKSLDDFIEIYAKC